MKFKTLSLLTILTTFICVGCTNSSNSEDKERIAQLEAQIAELKSSNDSNNSSSNGTGTYIPHTSESSSTSSSTNSYSSDTPTNFLGTYRIVDNNGTTFYFILNQDETANVKSEGSDDVLYCSWRDLFNINKGVRIDFSDKRPIILFDGGIEKYGSVYLKDGWLYAGSSYVESKHPQWRLKAERIN